MPMVRHFRELRVYQAAFDAATDVFDALCSKRPYKEPFPDEKSLTIIRSEAGKHFDPAVVDAFFAVQPEILDTKNRFKDAQESRLFSLAGGATGDAT